MDKEKIRQEACEQEVCEKCEDANNSSTANNKQNNEQQNNENNSIIDDLKQQIALAEQKRDEYLDMAKRIQADFENYKRRNKSAISDAYRDGILDAVEAFLPVLDNLERALDSSKNSVSDEGKAISKGIEMVVKQFGDIMAKMDIEEIEALGKPFDPAYHNAVMQVEAENDEQKNMVVEVLQKGYKQKDKVIRYSMVKVAN